jgi:hypothetical protein
MRSPMHKSFCFAGQPAPCSGYFANDMLPCVCGATGNLLTVLGKVAQPVVPVAKEEPLAAELLPLTA